jgi:hypothetical protein
MVVALEKKLEGHGYERANICAECGGQLDIAGHYHTLGLPAEPICHPCAGQVRGEGSCRVRATTPRHAAPLPRHEEQEEESLIGALEAEARRLGGRFTIQALWRKTQIDWFEVRRHLRENPVLFKQTSKMIWELVPK